MKRVIKYKEKKMIISMVFVIIFFVPAIFNALLNFDDLGIIILAHLLLCAIIFLIYSTIVICKCSIVFDYEKNEIRYLYPTKYKVKKVKIIDIVDIKLVERFSIKEKDFLFRSWRDYNSPIVYNNGKRYTLVIKLKNKNQVNIPYYSLYKTHSVEETKRFENYVNEIISEFYELKFKRKFPKDKEIKRNKL